MLRQCNKLVIHLAGLLRLGGVSSVLTRMLRGRRFFVRSFSVVLGYIGGDVWVARQNLMKMFKLCSEFSRQASFCGSTFSAKLVLLNSG
ncbi:hypothetical protein BH10CHL1_BH10CHL1_25280 [soil metagenome]